MKTKVNIWFAAGLWVLVCVMIFLASRRHKQTPVPEPVAAQPFINTQTNMLPPPHEPLQKLAAQLSPEEKAKFLADFEKRFKPAIGKWMKAYGAHVPLNLDSVTPDKLYARVGRNDVYHEYVFVIDGVTLAVRDRSGVAEVDYLNNPEQTSKLTSVPQRAAPPTINLPVQRMDVIAMVQADSGVQYPPDQIRMIPSGLSGSLDGGAFVHVGGDPQNGASWKFDMVFAPDGKLAYYLRGVL